MGFQAHHLAGLKHPEPVDRSLRGAAAVLQHQHRLVRPYAALQERGIGGASKGSINRLGVFQTGEVMGLEAHVKDTARFKGGWAFFGFAGDAPARQIPYGASCYSCHQAHAAADTTFVQFYPTLLPVATKLRTLNPAYVAEAARGGSR